MHKIDSPNADASNEFTDGDPPFGIEATEVWSKWLNTIQRELVAVVESEGITLDDADDGQVLAAITAKITALQTQIVERVPAGSELNWPASTPPTGWLEEDGAAYSMTTYEDLFDVLGVKYGKDAGVAFTADYTTDTLTSAGHGRSNGDILTKSNSGGALPGGLSEATKYYVINATTDTFQVSITNGGAAVDLTDNGTGTHYFHTQFKVPDMRGEFARGWDHGAGNDPDAASRTDSGDGTTGDNVGTKQADEFESHYHSVSMGSSSSAGGTLFTPAYNSNGTKNTNSRGGNETRPRNVNKMWIIKY